jgi:hypothetical protein
MVGLRQSGCAPTAQANQLPVTTFKNSLVCWHRHYRAQRAAQAAIARTTVQHNRRRP